MEKRNKIIITFFCVVVVILGITTVYLGINIGKSYNEKALIENELLTSQEQLAETQFKLNEIEKKNTTANDKIKDSITDSSSNVNKNVVPINDLFAYDFGGSCGIALKIDDGSLYYSLVERNDEGKSSLQAKYIKLDTDVKRIKPVQLRSDPTITYYIIKNDGSVYHLGVGYDLENNEIKNYRVIYRIEDRLVDYKIDDILSAECITGSYSNLTVKAVLSDGKIEEIVK